MIDIQWSQHGNGYGTATNMNLPKGLNRLTLCAYEVMKPIGHAGRWEVLTADCSGEILSGTARDLATARDCAAAAADVELSRRLAEQRRTASS